MNAIEDKIIPLIVRLLAIPQQHSCYVPHGLNDPIICTMANILIILTITTAVVSAGIAQSV
jgi:hypothetical protein